MAARAYLTYPFPADCPHKKVVLEGELIMKRVSWHFLHQMVFAFLVLTPLHLSAQDYYHQLNVRIVNNSGVEMSAYVDVGGLDNGYSSKSCFMGMNNLPDGGEFAKRCNTLKSPHQVLNKIAFYGVANCYPTEGGFQGSAYRFPEDSSQYYLTGTRGNAPVNRQGEYVLTFEYGSLPCEVPRLNPFGEKKRMKKRSLDPSP